MATVPSSETGAPHVDDHPGRGSALIAAVFVLSLLTTMALILMFAATTEVKMSHADVRSKQAFFMAEAGTERGREQLRLNLEAASNGALAPHLVIAAGPNGVIDFDPDSARPTFAGNTLTGFTGVGDDVPLVDRSVLGEGWYAVFMTNDPADGEANLVDSNGFVMMNGFGVTDSGAFEVAQAIVQPGNLFPALPATITLLGPNPEFKLGSGKGWAGIECPEYPDDPYLGENIKTSKIWVEGALMKGSKIQRGFQGTDCAEHRELGPVYTGGSGKKYASLVDVGGTGGVPGLFLPTIGVVGAAAEADVEGEAGGSKIWYLSDNGEQTAIIDPTVPAGGYLQDDTIADLTDGTEPTVIGSGLGTLHPTFQDCNKLKQVTEKLKAKADYSCVQPGCTLPALTPSSVSFIQGDFRVDCAYHGYGVLAVTGELDFPASSSWNGVIWVVGEGKFYRVKKEGYGNISGATLVADIAGPDNKYGTADDCTGGTGGFSPVYFEEQKKKAWGTSLYCSDDINLADPGYKEPTVMRAFRQR